MNRRNKSSKVRTKCSHCKVTMSSDKPHRPNCKVKNNEHGWPRETEKTRLYGR
ncbi:hypothetical protein SEA_OLICIOUS_50 [Streptomyces phage Olicious]|uniref:Uncharacterized protein n=6 Tax=Immanueltrevirus immanuel3 TaxID=2846399 RepID=A0A2H5BM64_9CAUD|nr:hypothetical protein SEA_HAUGEANATOR_50 [Streptomyces phage HaugeAnator]AUG87419.1 hypothetical protein SEA_PERCASTROPHE_50 [Streptomyces phage Percastrophe]AUG87483.1 hypothetical protein SEA_ROMERO_50 [Streptomyces phage Romero]AUG87547.1 hypothetical protein SEA_TORITOKI_50 [Streptomyces phage ToriToki]AUG87611.1 hypothetical protein SEA_ZOOBEAR_50 [Streptomyces phage ZooBear]AZF95838.1 hypothetical protein SEA_OLICIOUS_50 [Streptomyces phage Olicious]UJQ86886.1 hypothetical protein SEA